MTKEEFNKCRPFDLAAAKAGEICIYEDGDLMKYVAPWASGSYHVFLWLSGRIEGTAGEYLIENVRMAPLTFIQGEPIYPGAHLRYKNSTVVMEVTGYNPNVTDKTGLIGTVITADKYTRVGDDTWAPFDSWELVSEDTQKGVLKFFAWLDGEELRYFLPSATYNCEQEGMIRQPSMDIVEESK